MAHQRLLVFRQLFEATSSTYTYLLGCTKTRQALIIDPVVDKAERDAKLIRELELDLKYVVNTHIHADHVTGTGELKRIFPKANSILCEKAGGRADLLVKHGDLIHWGEGFGMEVRETPGHTDGCDRLPARSVHSQIFNLPPDYLIYPAHDYDGRTVSSVEEEKKYNPRLAKSEDEFVAIMKGLRLPYPKQIDKAVPANLLCGIYELMDDALRTKKTMKWKRNTAFCTVFTSIPLVSLKMTSLHHRTTANVCCFHLRQIVTNLRRKVRKRCKDDRIAIELSPISVDTLNELFGDGQGIGECSDTGVNLPIWLCDLLYKAIQKMPIANSLREEFELQNDATIVPKKCRRDKNISLKRLYEMFPSLSKKLINRVAKEMDYDYDQTALYLVSGSDDDPIDAANSADDRERRRERIAQYGGRTEALQGNEDEIRWLQKCEHLRLLHRPGQAIGVGQEGIDAILGRTENLEDVERGVHRFCINLGAERALATVVQKINICREKHPNIRKLHVITGYGKTTGTPVIKPRLLAFLKGKGMEARVSPKNLGVVEISLGSVFQHIDYP
uniref:Lactamase_B domain-containing protein n=1 Tax=Globodera pallida TaxID=36090 RepID=A0A183CD17_GLOPA